MSLLAPRQIPHRWKKLNDSDGRLLILVQPAGRTPMTETAIAIVVVVALVARPTFLRAGTGNKFEIKTSD